MADSVYSLNAGDAVPSLDIVVTGTDGDVPPDLAVTPVTLVLEGPRERHVFRWRPGGTSHAGFSYSGGRLRFAGITKTFSATHLNAHGDWPLYVIENIGETTQRTVGTLTLRVSVPPYSALPVTE